MTTKIIKNFHFEAKVEKIIDGDTIDVLINVGAFYLFKHERIRLEGVNAPEKNTIAGKASKAALEAFLPKDTVIEIWTKKADGGEKFGRFLAKIEKVNPDKTKTDVAQWLIDNKLAKPWDGNGERPV